MWQNAGIEGRPNFKALLYNEPAQTLISHFERLAGGKWPVGEIYTRSRGEQTYNKVPGATDLISYDRPISAESAPLIFFNELHLDADLPGTADWGAVRCLDLAAGQMRTVVST